MTRPSIVGFISLGGIAARNGILLVAHYVHLMKEEGEQFTASTICEYVVHPGLFWRFSGSAAERLSASAQTGGIR